MGDLAALVLCVLLRSLDLFGGGIRLAGNLVKYESHAVEERRATGLRNVQCKKASWWTMRCRIDVKFVWRELAELEM